MPVSLNRRIRRIGIPLKDERPEDWKVDYKNPTVGIIADELVAKAKHRRRMFFAALPTKQSAHRRSRSRTRTSKREVSSGKK